MWKGRFCVSLLVAVYLKSGSAVCLISVAEGGQDYL